jgi:hypothetical protein
VLANLAAVLAMIPAPVALAPTEPAPTDVTLAWTSAARTEAVITWDETGDVRNKLVLIGANGPAAVEPKFVEAGQPNRTSMWGGLLDESFHVEVTVVDADGNELSDPAESPEFDTNRDPAAVITSVVPRPDGTIRMTWKPGVQTDPNPGDPLDTPDIPFRYIPVASQATFPEYDELAPATTATSFVVPKRETPVQVGLKTAENGWYGWTGVTVQVLAGSLTVSVKTGDKLTVSGKATKYTRVCDLAACERFTWDDEFRKLQLQKRDGAGWTTVANTAARKDGTYTFSAAFTGAGNYRVVAPATNGKQGQDAREYVFSKVLSVAGGGNNAGGGNDGGGNNGGEGGGGGLPITGTPVMWIALAGGLLVVLGVAFATLGRVRRRKS